MQINIRKKKSKIEKSKFGQQFAYLRITSIFLFGIFILIVGWTAFYTQQTIQTATIQAQQIIIIKSELSIEPIDFEKFESIQSSWDQKHTDSIPNITKNPFKNITITTTTPDPIQNTTPPNL